MSPIQGLVGVLEAENGLVVRLNVDEHAGEGKPRRVLVRCFSVLRPEDNPGEGCLLINDDVEHHASFAKAARAAAMTRLYSTALRVPPPCFANTATSRSSKEPRKHPVEAIRPFTSRMTVSRAPREPTGSDSQMSA